MATNCPGLWTLSRATQLSCRTRTLRWQNFQPLPWKTKCPDNHHVACIKIFWGYCIAVLLHHTFLNLLCAYFFLWLHHAILPLIRYGMKNVLRVCTLVPFICIVLLTWVLKREEKGQREGLYMCRYIHVYRYKISVQIPGIFHPSFPPSLPPSLTLLLGIFSVKKCRACVKNEVTYVPVCSSAHNKKLHNIRPRFVAY